MGSERYGGGRSPLLEREGEAEGLSAAIASAGSGAGVTVLLRGPAGIGKTALLRLARERAGERDFATLAARGGEFESELPWAAVRELYAPVLADGGRFDRSVALAGSAALASPVLEPARAGGKPPSEPGADALAAAVHGLYWLTSNLSEHSPVLLAVDDAHLCDPFSLRFLGYLAARIEDLRIVLVVSARPPEPGTREALPDALVSGVRMVQPAPLSESGVARLVGGGRGGAVDTGFAAACRRATAGNPYLVRELALELSLEGIEPTSENADRVGELTPEAISRGALLRLARFGEPLARLAEAVTVLGPRATVENVATLAGVDPDLAADAAAQLAAAEVLAEGVPLRFAHPIVRAAVYDGIAAPRRAQLHRRAADVLTAGAAPARDLAVHLMHCEAGAGSTAVSTLRAAAYECVAGGAPESAAAFLRRALEEASEPGPRRELLLDLAAALAATGSPEAIERLEEALEIAGSAPERARILLRLGWMQFNAGQPAQAAEAFGRGVAIVEAAGEADLAAELRTAYTGMGALTGEVGVDDWLESLNRDPAGEGTDEPAGAAEREVLTQLALAHVITSRDSSEARRLAERALGGGEMLAQSGVSLTWSIAASCLIWADALSSAEHEIDRALELLAERGDVLGTAYVRFGRSWVCYWQGRVAEAAEDAQTAVRAWSAGGRLAGQLPMARYWHAVSLLELDEPDAAARAIGARDPSWGEHYAESWQIGQARVAGERGDLEAAWHGLKAVEAYAARIPLLHTPATYSWRSEAAIAAARIGAGEEASRLAGEELALARTFGAPRPIGIALRAAGVVAGGSRGNELLAESVAVLERSPSRLELCRSLVEQGAALRRTGHPARAREPLRRGLALAHELGTRALERRAREELTAAGARPRRTELSGPRSLTPGERRVCELAAQGHSNREIAQQLFISLRTVETHLTHAYAKLEISSRRELGTALAVPPPG